MQKLPLRSPSSSASNTDERHDKARVRENYPCIPENIDAMS
jgi:hypothetical protein